MTTTAKGIREISTSAFIKNGPTDFNNALTDVDGLIDTRGKSIIATAETRSTTTYGTLTTPDVISGVVLPTDGIIAIWYHALWQESVAGAGSAAIFIGTNQLKLQQFGSIQVQQASIAGNSGAASAVNKYNLLGSFVGGLFGGSNSGSDAPDPVTTGQVIGGYIQIGNGASIGVGSANSVNGSLVNEPRFAGGPCYVFAAAGTYDISVQFKASSGSVTVKNRRLWVRVLPF